MKSYPRNASRPVIIAIYTMCSTWWFKIVF